MAKDVEIVCGVLEAKLAERLRSVKTGSLLLSQAIGPTLCPQGNVGKKNTKKLGLGFTLMPPRLYNPYVVLGGVKMDGSS